MKKRSLIIIALAAFILPILIRGGWFYRGFYAGNNNIKMPDYETFTLSQPTIATPAEINYEPEMDKKVILFDQAHTNQYTLAEVDSLRNQLIARGAEVAILEPKGYFSEMLNKADAFVVITPVHYFSYEEIEQIEEFVHRGGRLVVIADPTRSYSEYDVEREDSVILVNELLQPYQLSFRNDYAYNLTHNEGNYRNIFVYPNGKNDLTNSVSELVFYGSHTLEKNIEKVLAGEEDTLSSLDDSGGELPIAAMDNSGNVLVIGDMTFMSNPYYQVADNYQFVQNIADFLVNGERTRNLYDFPSLFNQDIAITLTSEIELDKDIISIVADIKDQYGKDDLSVTLSNKIASGIDRIVLGIYPPDEDLDEEIRDLGIVFDLNTPTATPSPTPTQTPTETPVETPAAEGVSAPESEVENDEEYFEDAYQNGAGNYYYVPGIGDIPTKGFGFILLKQDEKGNHLYLLSDSQENAANLLQLLVEGSLEGCLVTENIAVCEQNEWRDNDYDDYEWDDDLNEDLMDEDYPLEETIIPDNSPTPTETSTPAG